MSFFKSLFGITEKNEVKSKQKDNSKKSTRIIDVDTSPSLTISASPIGDITGSTATDFYVYVNCQFKSNMVRNS